MSNRDDETTISKAEKVMDALQLIAGQVAKRVPVPQAQLMQNFLGKGGLVTSLGDLFDKIENKTAKLSDYGQVVADVLVVAGSVVVLAGGSPAILAAATAAGIATAAVKYFPEAKEWLKENFPKVGDWLDKNVPDWVAKADTKDLNSTQLAQLNSVNAESFKLAMSKLDDSQVQTSMLASADERKTLITDKVLVAMNDLCDRYNYTNPVARENTCWGGANKAVHSDFTGHGTIAAGVDGSQIALREDNGNFDFRSVKFESREVANIPAEQSKSEIAAYQPVVASVDNDLSQVKTRSGPSMA